MSFEQKGMGQAPILLRTLDYCQQMRLYTTCFRLAWEF